MRRIIHYAFSLFIIVFWFTMMGLLISKEFLPKTIKPINADFSVNTPYIRRWHIYSDNIKLGFLKINIYRFRNEFILKNIIRVKRYNEINIHIRNAAKFDLDKKLNSFSSRIDYNDISVYLKGAISGSFLNLHVYENENSKEYQVPWDSGLRILDNGLIPFTFIKNIDIGDKFNWYFLNPLNKTNQLVTGVVTRSSFLYYKKDFVPVFIVELKYGDINTEFWLNKNGEPLKIQTPWRWSFVLD